jgi:hypothetical protein
MRRGGQQGLKHFFKPQVDTQQRKPQVDTQRKPQVDTQRGSGEAEATQKPNPGNHTQNPNLGKHECSSQQLFPRKRRKLLSANNNIKKKKKQKQKQKKKQGEYNIGDTGIEWACQSCTFVNNSMSTCEMCGGHREAPKCGFGTHQNEPPAGEAAWLRRLTTQRRRSSMAGRAVCLITVLSCVAVRAEDADNGLYMDVKRDVNTSDCLRTLQMLPLKTFVFKHDKDGRRVLGLIPSQVKGVVPHGMPSAVGLIRTERRVFPRAGTKASKLAHTVVDNFATVDDKMMAAYTVGSVQELLKQNVALQRAVSDIHEHAKKHVLEMEVVKRNLLDEIEQDRGKIDATKAQAQAAFEAEVKKLQEREADSEEKRNVEKLLQV